MIKDMKKSGLERETDFYHMLHDMCDLSGIELDEEEIRKIKEIIVQLKTIAVFDKTA